MALTVIFISSGMAPTRIISLDKAESFMTANALFNNRDKNLQEVLFVHSDEVEQYMLCGENWGKVE